MTGVPIEPTGPMGSSFPRRYLFRLLPSPECTRTRTVLEKTAIHCVSVEALRLSEHCSLGQRGEHGRLSSRRNLVQVQD